MYSIAQAMPDLPDNPTYMMQKTTLLQTAKAGIDDAIRNVERMALTISKIQRNKQIRQDIGWLTEFVGAISQALYTGLAEYQKPLSAIGLSANSMAESLNGQLITVLESKSGSTLNTYTGNKVSSIPARPITADEIVEAMDDSVPYCEPLPQPVAAPVQQLAPIINHTQVA
jgi:hypothetical protein